MERIVLEVDSRLAKKWQEATATKRDKIVAFLKSALELLDEPMGETAFQKGYGLPDEETIAKVRNEARENEFAYKASLDRLRKEARANGLTQEVLDGLLAEIEEETSSRNLAVDQHLNLIQQLQNKAASNGLTDEMLDQLLEEIKQEEKTTHRKNV